ncbi:hypothetical protein BDY19DRAFT_991161 [Irpex rosettiformis]|uniref:Uncharacterized protein n=1 Tax=Irpex rosettiformis TaxID=378272 RepID=A0ACB8UB18_9APHY|nr:hypothetical protein BDY19DRAFT_991161 [Irpex rosettiformis]
MSDVAVSSEKPSPRTTYVGRMKKKREKLKDGEVREIIEDSEKEEETEEMNGEDTGLESKTAPVLKPTAPEKTFVVPQTPASASRKPLSSASVVVPASGSKHIRNGSTSSVQGKPQSHAGIEGTESISDAESIATIDGKPRRKRKSEAERIQFFKDDLWCQEVEAHRILCRNCGEWKDLHPKRRFVMQNWLAHKKACPGSKNPPLFSTPKPISQVSALHAVATPIRTQTPSSTTSDTLGPMEAEGKATLENDFRTGEIRPHEVFCTQCATWVKLYPTTKYSPKNWLAHVQQCPGTASSSAAPTAVEPSSPPAPIEDDTSSTVAVPSTPSVSEKAPIIPKAVPAYSRKRARDSDDDDDDISVSPAKRQVRPRTDSYKPPLGRALWDLVTKPITSFIQGFKHGIKPDAGTGSSTGSSTGSKPEEVK